jgi:hypothetical protein
MRHHERKRGRPRASASNLRSAHIALRLTPEERDSIAYHAKARGLTLSAYLHACAMRALASPSFGPLAANESTPPVQCDALRFELVRQLRAIGVNLNQIAKHANSSGMLAYDRVSAELPELASILAQVDEQIARLL